MEHRVACNPKVPAAGRDEPRKTAKCVKPTHRTFTLLLGTDGKTIQVPQKKILDMHSCPMAAFYFYEGKLTVFWAGAVNYALS